MPTRVPRFPKLQPLESSGSFHHTYWSHFTCQKTDKTGRGGASYREGCFGLGLTVQHKTPSLSGRAAEAGRGGVLWG